MPAANSQALRIFAPAKINLYLHVTERLRNGYHTLDSLICFADIGDVIEIREADGFSFDIDGPFSEDLEGQDSTNLVVRAAYELSKAVVGKDLSVSITLTKNLPLGAGLGGGSSDAAAVLKGLLDFWEMPRDLPFLPDLMLKLGADVPVCFSGQTTRVLGIGEVFEKAPDFPSLPVVLIHPDAACHTEQVFQHFSGSFKEALALPPTFEDRNAFVQFLKTTNNDLYEAAISHVRDIANVIDTLEGQTGCLLARMSGSGSACFGIFETGAQAKAAAQKLQDRHPAWWIENAILNG